MQSKPIISVTDNAVSRIKYLIAQRDKPTLGIRVGVKTGGCSGMSYVFEYAEEKLNTDIELSTHDIKLFIDSKAQLFIIGTTLDYEEDDTKSGFIFNNPNEKGNCGCGKSFSV